MRPGIFISYSHRDSELVAPVVALLRASQALVFRDTDQLKPGVKWRQQLDTAISDSRILVVFWCSHSRSSEEVRKEYTAAIGQQKEVLPLLIDDTPLPPELAEYQYIDFRAAFPHGHAAEPLPSRPAAVPSSRAPAWRFPWIGAALVIAAISSVWMFDAPPPVSGPGVPGPSPELPIPVFPMVLLTLFIAIVAAWLFKRSRRRQRVAAPSMRGAAISQQQKELATTIENELLKRVSLHR